MTNKEIWETVLSQIQFNVSKANFATWFGNTKIKENKNGKVLVSVKNSFVKEWLNSKYKALILKILREVDKKITSIDFIVEEENKNSENLSEKSKKRGDLPNENQLPLNGIVTDKKTNLNPKYTFDNFVVGRFNELAQAAAWAVAENPDGSYNPLFIYGNVGLGKTHLLQATGNKIADRFKNKNIRYISSESFVTNIVEAIKNREISKFKENLKKIEVLILDDVQFFSGKEKSQEEFYHIFNLFYQQQKQIILSSDRPPKSIPALQERLRSRFEGGMIVDIGTPDYETRLAILKEKTTEKNISLKDDVLEYIASVVRTNIREMEGVLNKLVFYKKINNKEPNIETAKKMLSGIITSKKKKTNFKKIIKTISDFYDLPEKELLAPTRKKEVVKPRQVAMFLLKEELKETYSSIGRKFGGKDHTTIMYACSKIEKEIKENDDFYTEINLVKQRLYNLN